MKKANTINAISTMTETFPYEFTTVTLAVQTAGPAKIYMVRGKMPAANIAVAMVGTELANADHNASRFRPIDFAAPTLASVRYLQAADLELQAALPEEIERARNERAGAFVVAAPIPQIGYKWALIAAAALPDIPVGFMLEQ